MQYLWPLQGGSLPSLQCGDSTALFILFMKVRRLRNKISTIDSSNTDQEIATAAKNREREHRVNVTFFLLFLALAGVSIPVGKIILDTLGVPQQSSLYSLAGILGWTVYHFLVIIDPLIIMRT